jgi:long-chain acyl-CoA synthetase
LPVALVESTQSAETVGAEVTSLVASYKRPRLVFVVDALPRVANGKVDRPAAARLAAELSIASPAGASPTGGPVK